MSSYIVFIAKTDSKVIGAWIVLYLYNYKPTIQPGKEYCVRLWAEALGCYLDMLDKLQKQGYRTAGPSPAVSLEPPILRRNVINWSLLYGYYFCRCSSALAELVPVVNSYGKSI